MNQNSSPELAFLKRGELLKLAKGDPLTAIDIARSILVGTKRNFSKDSERLVKNLEAVTVTAAENIPVEHVPIIVASNHPDIYDLVAGTIFITQTVDEVRKRHNIPGDIHWMITEEIPPREVMKDPRYKTMYKVIDFGLRKLNHTYGFISVPLNPAKHEPQNYVEERAMALRSALKRLDDENGSRIVGMFPEGEISKGNTLRKFYEGIGLMAQSVKAHGVLVLPVGIYRDALKHLNVEFGKPLAVEQEESSTSVTERVRNAISDVSKKNLER